jgi:glucose/mannose transport system permease protein
LAPRRNWARSLRLGRMATYAILIVAAVWYVIPVYLLFMTGLKGFAEANNQALMWKFPTAANFDSFQRRGGRFRPTSSQRADRRAGRHHLVLHRLDQRLHPVQVALPWIRDAVHADPLRDVHPYQAILIPLFQVEKAMGLYGSIEGLVMAHVIYGIPITTLIFRNYYVAIPEELVEASKVDGASFFGIYRHILLPLSVPGFVVVLIWQFTSAWNDFLFGSLLTRQSNWPITVAVNNLAGSFQWPGTCRWRAR